MEESEIGKLHRPVEPDEQDVERWYRIQFNGVWFAIFACCRSCATRKYHETFGYVLTHHNMPEWIVRL